MITIEIYWDDLTERAQNEILKKLNITNKEHNWDVFPIATVDIEGEE